MFHQKKIRVLVIGLALLLFLTAGAGSEAEKVTELSQLDGKVFAVPGGTVADQLVLTRFPNATFLYYDSALDACLAVRDGKADAAAYDEPILKNIAAKNPGLVVLPELITKDDYGFAVGLGKQELKSAVDKVVTELKSSGKYDEMLSRWLPKAGAPGAMPAIQLSGDKGVLKFGTAAITEPFSFLDGNGQVVGFDVELAALVAQELGMKLEVVNLDFGWMIPALTEGKVDMIGACITITEERAKQVLFSEPYYTGGIAALVKE
jgi:polar amino acid transport system substrate-binding protein